MWITNQVKQTLKELVLAFGVVLLLIQFMGCIGAVQDRQAAYANIRSNVKTFSQVVVYEH